jgi:hypothetical protein
MKKDVVDFIVRCMECQKVKVEQKYPSRFLWPLSVPEWKWEVIAIDFITKVHRTTRQHDSIMVVEDKPTKVVHFMLVKITHKTTNIAEIYMKEIVRLHGVPKTIVSDQDPKFTSIFWKGLFKGFGTNLNFSTTYHLETNEKTKRINRIIEDMLRMYAMDKPSRWEDYLHLVQTAYNNGYHESFKMSLFEAMYDIKCNMSVGWDNPTDKVVIGP